MDTQRDVGPDWIVLRGINPEAWTVPDFGVARTRSGTLRAVAAPNLATENFQNAVKEALLGSTIHTGDLKLTFYFWRRLENYVSSKGRKVNKHIVDTTNLQKALEDALQGVVLDNDRNVKDIRSVQVKQTPDTEPGIVIKVEKFCLRITNEIPRDVLEELWRPEDSFDNSWG